MKKVLIRKDTDFEVIIDENFNIIFTDNFNGGNFSFPVILEDNIVLDIPEYNYNIIDFLNHKKTYLMGEDVNNFLTLTGIDNTPFIWLLMKTAKIDVFFNKESVYVIDFDSDKYIVFNNKNMSTKIFDQMYRNQMRNNTSVYADCKNELYIFVRERFSNSIGHNEFVNSQIKDFTPTKKAIEKEFQKTQQFDIKKVLFLYENLIRLKENYLNENHYLLSEEVIQEISQTVEQIRHLLCNPPTYSSRRV